MDGTNSDPGLEATPIVDISAITAHNNWDEPQMAEQDITPDRDVVYRSRLEDGSSRVTYDMDYLELVRRGGPVQGVSYLGSPFRWRFPQLSIKVQNRSEQAIMISQALIQVEESEVIEEPLLVLEDLSVDKLVIRNEGWGSVVDPVVKFVITKPQGEGEVSLFTPVEHTINMKTFEDVGEIALPELMPERLRNSSVVIVRGTIRHGSAAARRELSFETRVSLQVRSAVGMPPTRYYDTLLKAGAAPVVEQVALAQEIAAGESDHFVIQLGADKSSRNRIRINLCIADGKVLQGRELLIDLFVPRTVGKPTPSRR